MRIKRVLSFAATAILAIGVAGCQCARSNEANAPNLPNLPNLANETNPSAPGAAFGANPANPDCGKSVYSAPACEDANDLIRGTLGAVNDIAFGCTPTPQPLPTPPAAAAPPQCDPSTLPKDAQPGDVYCCVLVTPPAAAPEKVCTCEEKVLEIPVPAVYETVQRQVPDQPARTEWQRIDCVNESGDCWKLVTIPATFRTECEQVLKVPASTRREVIPPQYELRPVAAPPPYWEWRKVDCRPQASTPNSRAPICCGPDCGVPERIHGPGPSCGQGNCGSGH